MMLMVGVTFRNQDAKASYRRFREKGTHDAGFPAPGQLAWRHATAGFCRRPLGCLGMMHQKRVGPSPSEARLNKGPGPREGNPTSFQRRPQLHVPIRYTFRPFDCFDGSFFTLSRNAVLRSVGRPCFFNKSLKASLANSWKSIMRSRASKFTACHVSLSNRTRLPGICMSPTHRSDPPFCLLKMPAVSFLAQYRSFTRRAAWSAS